MTKNNKTNKEQLANLLSYMGNSNGENISYVVDKVLTDAGYKADEVGQRFREVANQSMAKSPHNWRNRAHAAQQRAKEDYLKTKHVERRFQSRTEIIDAINSLISQQNMNVGFAHRNFSNQTDEDLESLLDQLEYLASQKSAASNE
jgi:ElaB/YqjD/DUF883 family membrane-anchored ribosome-binding protein